MSAQLGEGASVVDAEVQAADTLAPWCRLTLHVDHNAIAPMNVWIGLPIRNWNGRFLGLGGAGFRGGDPSSVAAAAPFGFAAAATDAGNLNVSDASFVLPSPGMIDENAVNTFAYLGVHEMTRLGKAATRAFYQTSPHYAYFSGCSNGGRQGLGEVQRYPDDYDGVLASAPAIYWSRWVVAANWRRAVANEFGGIASCKLETARQAAIASCDGDDGLIDGLLADPSVCRFDVSVLVNVETACGPITASDAEAIRQIVGGPRTLRGAQLWAPYDTGAIIAPTHGDTNTFVDSWFRYFLAKDQSWTPDGLTTASLVDAFDQSVAEYSATVDNADPDISRFLARGGRLLMWHGLSDDNFPSAGSIAYWRAVRRTLGAGAADHAVRLYLAPGVGHCGGGPGPLPVGLLSALMRWVENRERPEVLYAENQDALGEVTRSRPLCPYPLRARYRGHGRIERAQSFSCR